MHPCLREFRPAPALAGLVALLSAVGSFGAPPAARAAVLTIVAKRNDQIGGGGISSLRAPSVNDVGEMVFSAQKSFSTDMLVKRDAQGALTVVLQAGAAAPGTNGAEFLTLGRKIAAINDAGDLLFAGELVDGVGDASVAANNDEGAWLKTANGTALVVRDSAPIPGGGGLTLDIAFAYPFLAEDGRVLYEGYSRGKTGSNTVPDTMVLGTPANFAGVDTSAQGFAIGEARFGATGGMWTAYAGLGLQRTYAVRASNGGPATTIVQDGDPAPGGGTYKHPTVSSVNASGTWVGTTFITAPQSVNAFLLGALGDDPTVAIKVGESLPGFGNAIGAFGGPLLIADDGSIAFTATDGQHGGLFRMKGATKAALALDGDQAAGLPTGVVYADVFDQTTSSMNSNGDVAFRTTLAGPGVNSDNGTALFLAKADGSVHALARLGDPIQLGPSQQGVITDISFAWDWLDPAVSGGSDGRPRWLNDAGQVAFLVQYDGGDEAVVLADVDGGGPTPTAGGGATKTPTPVPSATPAFADKAPTKCRAAIVAASEALVAAETKAEAACVAKVIAGKLPGATDCRTETKAAEAIAKAQAKLRTAVAKACGGKDKTCGAGGDDVGLALLGWSVGTCPGVKGGACGAAIADCDDVATCVTCVGETLVDRALDVATGALAPTDPKDKAEKPLNACQAAIAKATATYLAASAGAVAGCWETVNAGKATGACPAADGKAEAAIAKAEAKRTAAICKACGGPDKACDGIDDFTPLAIGFLATCPDVKPPGGTSCASTPTSLADLAACVGCVSTFGAECGADVTVPGIGAYPASCHP